MGMQDERHRHDQQSSIESAQQLLASLIDMCGTTVRV